MSASASLNFSLPRTKQGDVDWDTLGNTLVEHLLAESLFVSRVDTKFGGPDTAEATVSIDSEWQFDYEKDEVVVFRKKNKSSKEISFSGRGVVNAPYKVIGNFVKDIESTFLWDKYLVDAKYLKTFKQTDTCMDYLGYQMHSTTHCFSLIQRDMLYFIRCQYKDGKYIMSAISVEDDDYPPQKFRPRCELHLGSGFVVEPFRGSLSHSLVTFFGNVDLKGLPLFITNQVLRRQPMAVKSIQRSFEIQQSIQNSLNPLSLPETSSEHTLPYEENLSLGMFLGKTEKK